MNIKRTLLSVLWNAEKGVLVLVVIIFIKTFINTFPQLIISDAYSSPTIQIENDPEIYKSVSKITDDFVASLKEKIKQPHLFKIEFQRNMLL